jgi:CMP-N-acetylneuraminic acid synthetase
MDEVKTFSMLKDKRTLQADSAAQNVIAVSSAGKTRFRRFDHSGTDINPLHHIKRNKTTTGNLNHMLKEQPR